MEGFNAERHDAMAREHAAWLDVVLELRNAGVGEINAGEKNESLAQAIMKWGEELSHLRLRTDAAVNATALKEKRESYLGAKYASMIPGASEEYIAAHVTKDDDIPKVKAEPAEEHTAEWKRGYEEGHKDGKAGAPMQILATNAKTDDDLGYVEGYYDGEDIRNDMMDDARAAAEDMTVEDDDETRED